MSSEKKLAPSHELGAKVLFAALNVLKENGGSMASADVIDKVSKRVKFDSWATERYTKTGYVRWQSLLHFFTIDASKAGFMIKKKGIWYLTPEGESSLPQGEVTVFKTAHAAYKKWHQSRPTENDAEEEVTLNNTIEVVAKFDLEKAEESALSGVRRAVNLKTPYEFQDMVAALLRAMGYFTPFVAPKGKDGGVDILAYRDPIGAVSPRIKVQVKHRDQTVSVTEIREVMGLLSKDGDTGLFVSSGGYSSDAKTAARNSHVHVELIDLDRFITLWIEYFDKMSDEDQLLLPIVPVYFAA